MVFARALAAAIVGEDPLGAHPECLDGGRRVRSLVRQRFCDRTAAVLIGGDMHEVMAEPTAEMRSGARLPKAPSEALAGVWMRPTPSRQAGSTLT